MDHLRVLNRISEVAGRDPERPALRAAGRWIGFGELVRAATGVRDLLAANGVGPEDVVATVLPRGGNSIIALLGIWMSGAAYLPTDGNWPRRRLDLVLAESATFVLQADGDTDSTDDTDDTDSTDGMPGEPEMRPRALKPGRVRARASGPGPRNLAYVLYTSGSTGTPNAVGVEYGALDNYASYLRDLIEQMALHTDDGLSVLLSANLCFDASLRPVLLLAAGAGLVLAPELTDGSWREQIDGIAEDRIAVLSGVPSWYSGLISAGFQPRDSGVRLAFVGGEPVPGGLVRELTAAGCAVVVQYGPTETTVAATGALLAADDFAEPPLGAPIPGARIHLFRGDGLEPAADGESGHIYVGGEGVARGYPNNPRLTAERFVPDPAGPPGSRLFRTGDLGRMLPDHGYGFLGRQDGQVKIAGRRIELGEVGSVLNRHPAVVQSVAFVHTEGAHPRLAACYVGTADATGPEADASIRGHLAAELPAYLVPALIRRVASLPVTDRGKVDVAALARFVTAGAGDAGDAADAGARPDESDLDDVERRVLAIVRKTLSVPCTLEDNFFALGGGSLDALDVCRLIREEFGVRVRLRDFFQAGTIRAVREVIGDVS